MSNVKAAQNGIATGANRGHIVTPRATPSKPSYNKGVCNMGMFWLIL